MSGKAGEDAVESAVGTGSTAEWVIEHAAELGLEPQEFLERILQAYRAAEDGSGPAGASTDESVEDVRERVETLEEDVAEMIEDVRERVIQVKRETNGKAPAEHEHADLESQIRAVQDETENIAEEVETLQDRLDGGFENYEAILEYLLDRTDEMATEQSTLAEAVLDLRERVARIALREESRRQADRIKRTGAESGVSKARCESCNTKVDLALLSRATCPACEATFQDLDPSPGFFGRSTLETGSRPALEAPSDAPEADEIEAVATGEGRRRPDHVDWFVGESEEEKEEEEARTTSTSSAPGDAEPDPESEGGDDARE